MATPIRPIDMIRSNPLRSFANSPYSSGQYLPNIGMTPQTARVQYPSFNPQTQSAISPQQAQALQAQTRPYQYIEEQPTSMQPRTDIPAYSTIVERRKKISDYVEKLRKDNVPSQYLKFLVEREFPGVSQGELDAALSPPPVAATMATPIAPEAQMASAIKRRSFFDMYPRMAPIKPPMETKAK